MAEEKKIDPFVAILREERLSRKIRMTDMAGMLGTPHATLSNYENGTSAAPRVGLMRDWAYALDYELVLNKVEKPARGRRRSHAQGVDEIPEDLNPVYLSKYQIALTMGMLIGQFQALRENSPGMAADLQVISDILARSIH